MLRYKMQGPPGLTTRRVQPCRGICFVPGRFSALRDHARPEFSNKNISERARHRPDQMSGGEQQRVAIARALATHPVLVLADEPTANLDTENGRQIMEIMQRLNQESGCGDGGSVGSRGDPRIDDDVRKRGIARR
jgi:alpha-D-ribose 1-methylphosphonate 5-triphosphate synthase subunit PhnL